MSSLNETLRRSARNKRVDIVADPDPPIADANSTEDSDSDVDNTMIENADQGPSTQLVAIQKQMDELRLQLQAATAAAANEKRERIRIQDLLSRHQQSSTAASNSDAGTAQYAPITLNSLPPTVSTTTVSTMCIGAGTAQYAPSISSSLQKPVSTSVLMSVQNDTARHQYTPITCSHEPHIPSSSLYTSVAASQYTWSLPHKPASTATISTYTSSPFHAQRLPSFLPPLSEQQVNMPPLQNRISSSSATSQLITPQTGSYGNGRKLHDLPNFTGRPEEWPMFSTAFRESTAMFGYSNVENIFRLQKCIKGDAKTVTEALLIHPDNVERVMAALEFRFGRPECLLQSQLSKVREISPISEGKLEMLVPFATRVQNFSTFLEASGLHQHLANPTLIDELVGKLPMSKRLEWAQQSVLIQPYPTVKHFEEWLNRIARLVCLVTTNSLAPQGKAENNQKPKSVLFTSDKPGSKSSAKERSISASANNDICRHCQLKWHPVPECSAYAKLDNVEKWNFVKRNRLCFSCLRYGHNTISCKRRKKCEIGKCTRNHHSSLHDPDDPSTSSPSTSAAETEGQRAPKSLLSCNADANVKILFRVLPVRLYNNDTVVKTFALLDEGSSITIMSNDIAGQLQLDGPKKSLDLQWFGKETSTEESSEVNLHISADRDDAERFSMTGVRTVSELCLPTQTLSAADLYPLFRGKTMPSFAEYENAKPQLIIGLDHCHLGAPIRVLESANVQPIVTETRLGWAVYGRSAIETGSDFNDVRILHCSQARSEQDSYLDSVIEEFFSMENFGVKKPTQKLISEVDERALRILSSTTKQVGSRFQTGLLWKHDTFEVPASFDMAKRRLWSLENKMKRDPEFGAIYKNIVADYLRKGYARKLTKAEAESSTPRTWYLPHFGVQNPNKPGKVRLVFDAAAKVSDVSLNTFLLKGPDELRSLLAILFNFRLRPVAVTGDIKEMFHQIQIQPEDQDSQRFLWRNEPEQDIGVYVMQSMTFGASCSPCSANFVKNLNALRFTEDSPRAVSAIIRNHYVDDYVDSFTNEAEAIDVTKAVISIHHSAGFELRNFASNSKRVLQDISALENELQPRSEVDLNIDAAVEKVLGMCWEPNKDVFTFKLNFPRVNKDVMMSRRCPTKREFLSIAMSVFDPFGMIANFVIHLKLLLQSVWSYDVEWDEPIPEEIFEKWKLWRAELPNLSHFSVPRCHDYFLLSASSINLHIFVDASEEAFSAVAYMRAEFGERTQVSFLCGKTRCAPRKLMTIPRLELSAAVLGIRLSNTIAEYHDMPFTSRVFWSDSKTVLSWIRSEPRRHKQFVSFRIAEILDSSRCNQWRWIPSKLNPADEATRARYPPRFQANNKWVNGPSFLQQHPDSWPIPSDDIENHLCREEMRPKFLLHVATVSTNLFDFSRFSKYSKLLRAAAWVIRFLKACRRMPIENGELSPAELDDAEKVLCCEAQRDAYANEIAQLSCQRHVKKTSSLYKLTPYLDNDGLLRVYGRIDAASTIPFTARRPMILPKDHKLTRMILDHFHRRLCHQNNDTIANEVRQKFWVPSLRSVIKRVKNDCLLCRIRTVQPTPPLMGQLPKDRLTPYVRPFTFTGLDYFGPVLITIGRRKEKRWVALFTCMTIRAVHLEIAADLSTDACILCIRNFVNRRGVPARIRSDNGTNFIGARNELQTNCIFDNEAIKAELSAKGIQWIFNCPSNPHAGGCWERLVRSVKRVLSHTLKEVAPRTETLLSALVEAENIINSRPLTYLPVSVQDEEPLTPNHFLLGGPNSTHTPGGVDDRVLCLRKQWRISQQIKDRFWKRWIKEYLPVLTRRCKWFENVPPISVGNLVLICDADAPRSQWKRGRVIKVYHGIDKQVRSAEIQTATGVIRRPSIKLAVLDVGETSVEPERLTGGGVL